MKLLLDQGLPRTSALILRNRGFEVMHTAECSLACASDSEILDYARETGRIVVTLDSDFHAILALSNASSPSAIRIRIEGLRSEAVAELVERVLKQCEEDLQKGALISIVEDKIRVRSLPISPHQ